MNIFNPFLERQIFSITFGLSGYVYLSTIFRAKPLLFLIDSGASISILKKSTLPSDYEIDTCRSVTLTGITDHEIFTFGSANLQLFDLNSSTYSYSFQLVDDDFNMNVDGILGLDFIQYFGAILDFRNWLIYLFNDNDIDTDLAMFSEPADQVFSLVSIEQQQILKTLKKNFPIKYAQRLESLCREYIDIFGIASSKVGVNNFYEQSIRLKNYDPVFIKNYRTPYSDKSEIDRQVQKMLDDDIIESSISEYNNPILLVPKKPLPGSNEKRWRLVVDFRQLNKKVVSDKFPLPRIDEILDKMGGSNLFCQLDFLSGFHQIPLHEDSRNFTSFTTDSGTFRFKRLPFGLIMAPNSFQRMMSLAFQGLSPDRNFLYMDDYCLTAKTEEEMFANLEKVFQRCRERNLTLNADKCNFFGKEVTYLGHRCTDKGIYPDDSKFEVIRNYPTPQNADEVRRFVALCNYYRKFVKDFALYALELTRLTKKNVEFEWTDACQKSFEYLKQKLIEPSVLQYPNFDKEFVLFTDASGKACGAVLTQKYGDTYLPISYASKAFNPAERKKPIIELELLAIHWGIKHFRPYLYGIKFLVMSDHKPLIYLFNMVNPSSKLTRIRLDLAEYNFDVNYIKGSENVTADALSRIPIDEFEEICHVKFMKVFRMTTRQQTKAAMKKQIENIDTEISPRNVYEGTRKTNIPLLQFYDEKIVITQKKKPRNEVIKNRYLTRKGLRLKELLSDLESCEQFDELAIEVDDKLFDYVTLNNFKENGNEILKNLKIILVPARIIIKDPVKQREIIQKYHNDTLLGGHHGVRKTIEKIKTYYNWMNLSKQVHDYVRACDQCQRNKVTRYNKQHRCSRETPMKPFEVVQIDLQGPFLSSFNQNKYICTIICELTKYLVAIPIPNKEASTVAKAIFEGFITTFGPMKSIVTDQGTEFKNELIRRFNELLKIQHNFATPYHHQTLGVVERNHRVFNEYLRTYVNNERTDWDAFLSSFVYCYNTTVSTITGYTPFELVFGKIPPNFDFLGIGIDPVYNYDDYVSELKFRLQSEHARVKRSIEKFKLAEKTKYDTNIRETNFEVGDLVLVRKESNHKHEFLFEGPFEVRDVEEFNVIVANNGNDMKVHKDRVKIYNVE